MGLFFAELKRRNVLRVAIAYLAASWLLIQLAETLFPIFGISAVLVELYRNITYDLRAILLEVYSPFGSYLVKLSM